MTTYAIVNFIPLVRDYEFSYWFPFIFKAMEANFKIHLRKKNEMQNCKIYTG
jgi:ABC-type microcin C transport system permease subunit YejE